MSVRSSDTTKTATPVGVLAAPASQGAAKTASRGCSGRRHVVGRRRPIGTRFALLAGMVSICIVVVGLDSSSATFIDTGSSTGNNIGTDTLDAPTGLTATGGVTVTLDWTATTDAYASGHYIMRSNNSGGPYIQIAQITPRTTVTYVDNPPNGTYYYVVRAFEANWESIDSNEIMATVAGVGGGLTYSDTGPSSTRTSSGPLTVSYPSGTQQNDLMLLVEVNAANQAITTPTGWALLADIATSNPSQFRFTIWWKLAASAETSVALDVHTNASGATAWAIRYADPAGYPPIPIAATATVAVGTSAGNATLTPTPDITTNQADATVISIVAVRDANTLWLSTPQSFSSQIWATQTAVGQPIAIAVADRTQLPLPSTPPSPTWTQSGTVAQWAWATVAFS